MPAADSLLSHDSVLALGTALRRAAPRRRWAQVSEVWDDVADLGLSDRARAVAAAIVADLHGSGSADPFPVLETIVLAALRDPAFAGWLIWPVTEAVAVTAIGSPQPDAFERGLDLLARLTPRLTSEFAIRTFLIADLDRTLDVARRWSGHDDEHVRRLASEGTRIRLPWARRVPALTSRPDATIAIIDHLYRDASDHVRRSAANHLNDISWIDAELAVRTARGWLAEPAPTTAPVVRRAMRTLVKQGHPGALALLGFGSPDGLAVDGPHLDAATVPIGGSLTFHAGVRNETTTAIRAVIDYVVDYRKQNGTLTPKVFKLVTRTIEPDETVSLTREHHFAELTTRRHHAGPHSIALQVNGRRFDPAPFTVTAWLAET